MDVLVAPTPPQQFLEASLVEAEHELFALKAPSFSARCHVDGYQSHMKIVLPRDCEAVVEQAGTRIVLGPGEAAILPLTSPFTLRSQTTQMGKIFQWRLPVNSLTRRHPHLTQLELSAVRDTSARERFLSRLLGGLAADFDSMTRRQTQLALSALVEALGLLEFAPQKNADKARIARACNYIQLHLHRAQLNAEEIATEQGVSRRYLDGIFKRNGSASISETISSSRLERAMKLLKQDPDVAILPLALSLGFENASHFARRFKQHTNMSPTEYKARDRR